MGLQRGDDGVDGAGVGPYRVVVPLHGDAGHERRVEEGQVFGRIVEEVVAVAVFQGKNAVTTLGDVAHGEPTVFVGAAHAQERLVGECRVVGLHVDAHQHVAYRFEVGGIE